LKKIEDWFDKLKEEKTPSLPNTKNLGLPEDTELLATKMPRSPYKELDINENVWICSHEDVKLMELTTQSKYVKAINEEWQLFPSFYLSFFIPNIKKEEGKKYKEKVFDSVAEAIAKS